MTQKEFADKAGVSRMSQVNYESGKRYPGEDYFRAIRDIGVDDYYLLSGSRLDGNAAFAAHLVLYELLGQLGLDEAALSEALEDVGQLVQRIDPPVARETLVTTIVGYVTNALSRSPRILEPDLLAEVLEGIDSAAGQLGLSLSPAKRARVAMILFRTAKLAGRVDPETMAEAIRLAAE